MFRGFDFDFDLAYDSFLGSWSAGQERARQDLDFLIILAKGEGGFPSQRGMGLCYCSSRSMNASEMNEHSRAPLFLKLYCWLFAISFAVLCASGWTLAHLVAKSLEDLSRIPPALTHFIIYHEWWLCVAPIPILAICTILSTRKNLPSSSVLLFTGFVFFLQTMVIALLALALALPYIPLYL